ncbi:hypothetical protein SELMODRAFT_410687 [Selaginella moellendorffii]|uniref:Uncharacterized protein n=1 Tax=Selaginella moellendorffii TaxID=88036 RepID=D8RFI8_SELML|nr:hypothetical protein SELMODRAFT_420966 [Selaginella moellendorffii]EFJ28873.1 hypothetical protein SELMODRAFT_410687 [Selaginella moellendorffii]
MIIAPHFNPAGQIPAPGTPSTPPSMEGSSKSCLQRRPVTACEIVREKWSSPFWRSDQPQSSNWEASGNQSCLISSPPNSSFSRSVPVYSVNASTPSHVQTVVKFPSAKNIHTGRSGTGSGTGDTTALLNVDLWSWELIVDDNNLNFVLHSLLIFSGNL